MHTICELKTFRRDAEAAGMTAADVDALVDSLSLNRQAGGEIKGTGGCRKLRIAGKGKGESGGYRVVTFFSGADLPVFLITVFAKGERANLSKSECNQLLKMTKAIVTEYVNRVSNVRTKQ